MSLISLAEYAEKHGRVLATARQKVLRGGFKTARKIGRNWVIDSDEPYSDKRHKKLGCNKRKIGQDIQKSFGENIKK